MRIEARIGDGRHVAEVDFGSPRQSLTASEIEAAVAQLCALRASMLPQVPARPDLPEGGTFDAVTDPGFATSGIQNGGTIVHVRLPGAGWQHLLIPPDSGDVLRDVLGKGNAALRSGRTSASAADLGML